MIGQRGRVLLALTSLYLVWGSTYLAMRWAIEGMAPLFMAGVRYVVAGGIIYGFLKLRGHAHPTARQWRNAGFVGTLLTFFLVLTVVAMFSVHWPESWTTWAELLKGYALTNDGFGNFKLPVIYIAMLLPLVLMGPGRLSLDALLRKLWP